MIEEERVEEEEDFLFISKRRKGVGAWGRGHPLAKTSALGAGTTLEIPGLPSRGGRAGRYFTPSPNEYAYSVLSDKKPMCMIQNPDMRAKNPSQI